MALDLEHSLNISRGGVVHEAEPSELVVFGVSWEVNGHNLPEFGEIGGKLALGDIVWDSSDEDLLVGLGDTWGWALGDDVTL